MRKVAFVANAIAMRALVVDDDKELNRFLRTALQREGFVADGAADGQEALAAARKVHYDVLLLDIVMPPPNGLDVLKTLRREGHTAAILLLTQLKHERHKLEGLASGADDYVVKPFSLMELLARIYAVLRRTRPSPALQDNAVILNGGGIRMDLLKRTTEVRGKPVPLTKTEFKLLECLLRHPGKVLSESVLAQRVLGLDYDTGSNRIEVHIARLRGKLRGGKGSPIETVRGFGYRLIDPGDRHRSTGQWLHG